MTTNLAEARPLTTPDQTGNLPGSPWTSALKYRADVIRTLLEQYADLTEPGLLIGYGSDGDGYPRMPLTYTPTIRELERLLRQMRDDRAHPLLQLGDELISLRACWWHINEWHIRARIALVVPAKQPRSKGKALRRLPVDDTGRPLPIKRTIRHPQARQDIAELGIKWLAENWPPDRSLKPPKNQAA